MGEDLVKEDGDEEVVDDEALTPALEVVLEEELGEEEGVVLDGRSDEGRVHELETAHRHHQ